MEDKRLAVLIDSDNVSAKYINGILSEITQYGIATYKRIYGDWTNKHNNRWREQLLKNAIIPIQQFSNTIGKNATDSTLIIDAMDILYAEKVDGFCIVSSDSDFTRLAGRLKESGMEVIGMGEKKTPESFVRACSRFVYLENLLDTDKDEEEEDNAVQKGKETDVVDKQEILDDIISIISENENNGKKTGLGEVGSRLVKKHPDFDPRNYGYSLLSKFIEEFPSIAMKKVHSTITVQLADTGMTQKDMNAYVVQLVQSKGGIALSLMAQLLREKDSSFNHKNYGYSSFKKYIRSIPQIVIVERNKTPYVVLYQ